MFWRNFSTSRRRRRLDKTVYYFIVFRRSKSSLVVCPRASVLTCVSIIELASLVFRAQNGRVIIRVSHESYWEPITVVVWRQDHPFRDLGAAFLLIQKDSLFFKNTKLLYVDSGYSDLALLFSRSDVPVLQYSI